MRGQPERSQQDVWRMVARRTAAKLWGRSARPAVPAARAEPLEARRLMSSTPLITEFLALNSTGLADENGDRGDWIELHNPGAADVNLDGYYLTDDAGNKAKWRLPSRTLPSGGYLVVFADSKNRTAAGAPLHTNFALGGGGGYLALVAPDGLTTLSEFNYPEQVADLSYGVQVNTTVTKLVGPAAAARTLVPTNGTLGTTWTAVDFNDAGWTAGPTGVGYETEAPQPQPSGFAVRVVDTAGGIDGNFSNIGEAVSFLDGALAANAFTVVTDLTVNRSSINMGSGGFFTGDQTLPNGTGGTSADENVAGREQYATRVTANVVIPAGQYTIDVSSDDGFRLKIPGVTFTGRRGEEFSGATNPSPADTLVYGGTRGQAHTAATFTVPAGGLTTTLQLDSFEAGGGDGLELSLASGQRSTFSTSTFSLLTNGLLGWAVRDPTQPAPPNYRSLIGTDVQAAMLNKNQSAYVRVPFNIDATGDFDDARLQVKYDDGFVAYLNGTEVARRFAPAAPAWNSGATASRVETDAIVYESIALPRSLLLTGTNVLAIHGLNAGADSTDFVVYPELQGLFTSVATSPAYFAAPTPAAANGATTSVGFVDDTKFNVGRGFYTSEFQLSISTDTPGASIRYTTDGTAPTATTGTLYAGPFKVATTTTVRAIAYKAGLQPTNVDTQSYIFPAQVATTPTTTPAGFPTGPVNGQIFSYGMDPAIVSARGSANLTADLLSIPSVSVVMNPADLFDATTGFYVNADRRGRAWERPTSIEFLYPDGSKENAHANAGVRVRGGYSRNDSNPKHGLHFYFRGEYGDPTFDYPIFGPDGPQSLEQFDLRTFNNYSWSNEGSTQFTGLRDQFSRDTQLAMGWQGERGDYYNLYINGQFWGIYNTAERAEASYGEEYFGGDAGDYDVVKVATDANYTIEATDGNLDAWSSLWTQAQGDMTSAANYRKLLGQNPDGSRNTAFPVLLDPAALIDYMLVIYYGGNRDAPLSDFLSNASPNNFFAVRNRVTNDQGFQFFAHDSEHTLLDANQDRTGNASGVWPVNTALNKSNPQWLFQMLMANADFKQAFADRVQLHMFDNGALTPAAVTARLNVRKAQIDRAVYGESARWGDSKTSPARTHTNWETEVNRILNSYVPNRTNTVLNQFRNRGWIAPAATAVNAPTFSQAGGVVAPGTQIAITNPNGAGTIYYTLDGSDPRLPGGGVSTAAVAYSGPIPITQTRVVNARVLSGTTWSPVRTATFTLATTALRLTELMYNPPAGPGGSPTSDDLEFLELWNTGSDALDLGGLVFSNGSDTTLPAGTVLGAGQRGVLVRNAGAFRTRYGLAPTILGTYAGTLSNSGEPLSLTGPGGQVIFAFTYADSWYKETDGEGYSLVLRNPATPSSRLGEAGVWRPSRDLYGNPGLVDTGVNPGAVVVNEVLAQSAGAGGDWVELRNTNPAAAIDVGGWFLSDSATDRRKYQFPAGTIIPANGYRVFYADASFGVTGGPGVNTPFRLDAAGDSVHLSNADAAGNAGGYHEEQDFGPAEPDVTFGRHVNSAGTDGFPAMVVPTPGGPNAEPKVGPLSISELNYYPLSGQEFIELRNLTADPLPLYDPANPQNTWRFTNGIDFAFPAGATIPAYGYALVAAVDPTLFRSQNGVPAAVPIFGPYTDAQGGNVLADGGERLTIARPLPPAAGTGLVSYVVVDSFKYDPAAPWPTAPAGSGPSLERVDPAAYGDDPANWQAGSTGGTPGRAAVGQLPGYVTASAGATFTYSNGALVVSGGTLTFAADGLQDNMSVTADGSTAAVVFNATQHLTSLTLANGAKATVAPATPTRAAGTQRALVVGTLSVDGSATGAGIVSTLDLGSNDLVVRNANAAAAGATATRVNALIRAGYAGTAWTGKGIRSSAAAADPDQSTALGLMLNNGSDASVKSTFSGQPVGATDVLVKFTYYGDADLNGVTNAVDYGNIDFNQGSPGLWAAGDYDYNGLVNGVDYGNIDFAFLRGTGGANGSPL